MAEQEDICLLQFLKNERHVSENSLDMMRMERIDELTLPLLGEDDLKPFLPSKGDRVAAREFCSKKLKGNEKKTLIDRLRQKFVPNSDTNRTFRGVGNGNASRTKRTVEIGWMNFCTDTLSYKQVRSPKGGGTRTVKFLKTDTASLVLEKGKSLFFPEGSSKIGRVSSFSFELCDFNLSKIDESSSIEDLYSEFQVRTLLKET